MHGPYNWPPALVIKRDREERQGSCVLNNRWLVLRIVLLTGLTIWAIREIDDPGVAIPEAAPAALPEVTLIGPPGLPSETAGDAGQVIGILSRVSGQAAGCGAAGTLRVRVGRGLEQALWSGIGEADCLRQAVGAQAWPALERPMELEWPIQP